MKKYFFVVMLTFICAVMLSVDADAQAVFGVKAGPLFSNMTTKVDGSKFNNQMIIGLTGGVYARLPLSSVFYVQPSLLYKGKGNTQNTGSGYKDKTRLNYLVLPIDFLFRPEMPSGDDTWFLGLGPYFAYGISGKISGGGPGSFNGDPFKEIAGSINRFDAGADILVVYEMASGLNFGLNAELGILNLADHGDRKNSVRNTSFGLTLGYTFGKY